MENTLYTQNDDMLMTHHHHNQHHHIDDMGPQSLPAVLNVATIAANSLQQQQQIQQQHLANNKFEQSGVFITDDEITVDIANNTGLRKTGYSNKIFGLDDNDDVIDAAATTAAKVTTATAKKPQQKATKMSTPQTMTGTNNKSKIPFSPMATPQRRRSIDNSTCNTGSLQDLHSRTGLPVFSRTKPVYRSVRKPPTSIGVSSESRKSKSPAPSVSSQVGRDVTNTWSGRSVMNGGHKRPTLTSDTFTPNTNGAAGASPFERNSKTRSSHILYDSNGRRIKGCTASLTTSPTKNHANSPLAQQLLEAASSAKNDAQILEKMKTLLLQYSTTNNKVQTANPNRTQQQQSNKKPDYEDFTTAWVHSNGNLERSSSCSPPTKSLSKRSSAASSCGSTQSKGDASVVVSPRRDRGMSKIPAPVRQHTELY